MGEFRLHELTDTELKEALKDARTEALEQAMKAVCPHCRRGVAAVNDHGNWKHKRVLDDGYFECLAWPIRALLEKSDG